MKETIELHLKAVDFKGTDFCEPGECAISKAVKRQLNAIETNESLNFVRIDGVRFTHELYFATDFELDNHKATSLNFDNTTIRTITLTKAQ